MKKSWRFLGLVALLMLAFSAPGAGAFSWSSGSSSVDAKASNRIADPEDLMNDMAAAPSGGVQIYPLGNGTVQFSAPASASSGIDSRFVTNPSTVIVPSRH